MNDSKLIKYKLSPDNRLIIIEEIAQCDLYNASGALIIKMNSKLPKKFLKSDFYISIDDFNAIFIELEKKETQFLDKNGAVLNSTTMEKAKEVLEFIESSFPKVGELTIESIKKIEKIVDMTLECDPKELIRCVSQLRTLDNYTFVHSINVYLLMTECLNYFNHQKYTDNFYKTFKSTQENINFNRDSIKKYSIAALLHDFGKINIPDTILNKPGLLSEDEFAIVKEHPIYAVNELKKIGIKDLDMLGIVGNHHYKYQALPKLGQNALTQICNIVDIYEACTSTRPYKKAFTQEKTFEILKKEKIGSPWDSYIFDSIIENILPNLKK